MTDVDGPTLWALLNAERLRRQRQHLPGLLPYSWARVSRESGVSHSTILKYKHGQQPRTDNLARLLAWLGE